MRGKGTTTAIFIIRMLGEKAIEMQKDLFLCFIDYGNAFDSVRHKNLLDILYNLNIDTKDLRIIRNLYYEQTAAVKVGGEFTEWIKIRRGVRQRSGMSPDLFSIYCMEKL